MRIALICHQDRLVIPQNIQQVIAIPGVSVVFLASVETPKSLGNRKRAFVEGFGVWQAARMAWVMGYAKAADWLDALFGYRLFARKRSIRAVAIRYGIPYLETEDPNSVEFCERLRATAPDLVVCYSAPCVFKPHLLAIPPRGCINLHCSLLPRRAGVLPSFWTLYYGDAEAGATVHYMDDKIDNGEILAQERLRIPPKMSMYRLIRETKLIGGRLTVDVIQQLMQGRAAARANDTAGGTYHTWPTVAQMREFRRRGGRLI